MLGIPPAKDTDAEDVAWGLQTAEALWKRGERADAIVWLRRAAQAAGDANDDDRALELARIAAELHEVVSIPPAAPSGELAVEVDVSSLSSPPTAAPVPPGQVAPPFPSVPPVARPAPPPVPSKPAAPRAPPAPKPPPPVPSRPPMGSGTELHAGLSAPPEALPSQVPPFPNPSQLPGPEHGAPLSDHAPSVPPAEAVHAGMFNPWEDQTGVGQPSAAPAAPVAPPPAPHVAPPPAPPIAAPPAPPVAPPVRAPSPSIVLSDADDEEGVVTSARPHELAAAQAASPPPPEVTAPEPPRPRPAPQAPPRPRLEPPRRHTPTPTAEMPIPPEGALLAAASLRETRPDLAGTLSAAAEAHDDAHDEREPPEAPAARGAAPDLDEVEAFADLPDEERARFSEIAEVHALRHEEEVAGFGLAYILEGELDVSATMVDAPAVRLVAGAVIRARGTTEDGVPMRLICSSETARLATWTDEAVAEAFRNCPWVEDDLRAAADRYQTMVGITIGPLGERLDAQIRAHIMSRLTMRSLLPGEVVVNEGEPVPGLVLVGVGELELSSGDEPRGTVSSGDFLFAGAVLNLDPAPATARAGKSGALVMQGDRGVAQELLVTCPPLLEVFAGM